MNFFAIDWSTRREYLSLLKPRCSMARVGCRLFYNSSMMGTNFVSDIRDITNGARCVGGDRKDSTLKLNLINADDKHGHQGDSVMLYFVPHLSFVARRSTICRCNDNQLFDYCIIARQLCMDFSYAGTMIYMRRINTHVRHAFQVRYSTHTPGYCPTDLHGDYMTCRGQDGNDILIYVRLAQPIAKPHRKSSAKSHRKSSAKPHRKSSSSRRTTSYAASRRRRERIHGRRR